MLDSGLVEVRPRSQWRVRDGFAPSSLFIVYCHLATYRTLLGRQTLLQSSVKQILLDR
jgi:hypothetical protein